MQECSCSHDTKYSTMQSILVFLVSDIFVLSIRSIEYGFSSYLYLMTRWCMKTQISSLARLIPGHIRGPLPNPRKLKDFTGACN
jgi:hypothetical protein